jgi:hypothetical protein
MTGGLLLDCVLWIKQDYIGMFCEPFLLYCNNLVVCLPFYELIWLSWHSELWN